MPLQNIALIGANGSLGSVVFDALLSAGSFRITTLRRKSSSGGAYHPSSVSTLTVPDGLPVDELTAALRGQDAVIACFSLRNPDEHVRVAEAAAAAGVKRMIPADFGSCDAADPRAQELVTLYRSKTAVMKRVAELAREVDGFSWTSLVCGHFFDMSLARMVEGGVEARKVHVLGDPEEKVSACVMETIGEAVVQILRKEEETSNRKLFVQSFAVSQNQIVAALEKATGEKFEVETMELEPYIEKHKKMNEAGEREGLIGLIHALGQFDANWEKKDDFANPLLGIKERDLQQEVKETLNHWKIHGPPPLY